MAVDKITRDEIKDYYDKHIENERTNAEEFVFALTYQKALQTLLRVHMVNKRNNTTTD